MDLETYEQYEPGPYTGDDQDGDDRNEALVYEDEETDLDLEETTETTFPTTTRSMTDNDF